jgi:hypothetical protein
MQQEILRDHARPNENTILWNKDMNITYPLVFCRNPWYTHLIVGVLNTPSLFNCLVSVYFTLYR